MCQCIYSRTSELRSPRETRVFVSLKFDDPFPFYRNVDDIYQICMMSVSG